MDFLLLLLNENSRCIHMLYLRLILLGGSRDCWGRLHSVPL